MNLQITPLCDALGAEINGIDWNQSLSAADIDTINSAFLHYHLLCLRAEPLEAVAFAQVARYFGTPQLQLLRHERDDNAPEVSILESTYKTPESKPADIRQVRLSGWHTDDSYLAVPAKATLLQALAITSSSGETRFANTRAAYENLSEAMKTKLAKLRAVHRYDTPRAAARPKQRSAEEELETPEVIHPLIRTHEDSGKKAIYLNANRTDRVVDMDRAESDALLDELNAHMTQTKYQYHHKWTVGDILLWDNRSLIHSVNVDYSVGEKRVHQRILLEGVVPV